MTIWLSNIDAESVLRSMWLWNKESINEAQYLIEQQINWAWMDEDF